MRFVCIDFETNGFPAGGADCMPFSSYPIQVSVDVVDPDSRVEHIYDSCIRGATRLAPWVCQNVPVSLEDISTGKNLK